MQDIKLNNELIGWGEAVKAQILYELKVVFDPYAFFKAKYRKDYLDREKLCKVIFKS